MANRYAQLIEAIFLHYYEPGLLTFEFDRQELVEAAARLNMPLPKNLGDVIYSFRYRSTLPVAVTSTAPQGFEWVIRPGGSGRYRFALIEAMLIAPSAALAETKILDATPGIVASYAFGDEQALLVRARYNRLVDLFTGLTCYSLQNHLRTTVPEMGQVETDELYVGLDRNGVHYVIPVQAKSKADRIGVVQIEQDFAVCAAKFPALVCRPMAVQFIEQALIALFEFELTDLGVRIVRERHYRLVPPDQLSADDLALYRHRQMD